MEKAKHAQRETDEETTRRKKETHPDPPSKRRQLRQQSRKGLFVRPPLSSIFLAPGWTLGDLRLVLRDPSSAVQNTQNSSCGWWTERPEACPDQYEAITTIARPGCYPPWESSSSSSSASQSTAIVINQSSTSIRAIQPSWILVRLLHASLPLTSPRRIVSYVPRLPQ